MARKKTARTAKGTKRTTKPVVEDVEDVEDDEEVQADVEAYDEDEEVEVPERAAVAASARTKMMHIGVPVNRIALYQWVSELADSFYCRASDLVWHALEQMQKNPPTVAPARAGRAVGRSPGFWVKPVRNEDDNVISITIVEVEKRVDDTGRLFFRFTKDDVKARTRALGQAVRAAEFDCDMLRISTDTITTEEFEE